MEKKYKSGTFIFSKRNNTPFPVIVCDDEIKEWDVVHHPYYNQGNLIRVTTDIEADVLSDGGKKVLVFPHQFSKELIEEIKIGKINPGQEVNVEMYYITTGLVKDVEGKVHDDIEAVKLKEDGTAIVFIK